jgi:amino acid transporter
MTLAAASIVNPDYVPETWHVFLLTTFLMIIHSCMASAPTKWIAKINEVGSTFNMIALVVVIIIIPAGNNRPTQGLPKFTPSSEVWGKISNTTDWPDGISVLMSFISVIWTMSGYDAPFHLAEECANANVAAPRAIVMTSAMGGLFGWFLQLVVAYTVVDIESALGSELGQPFAAYLTQILPQKIVLAVLSMTIIAGFCMGEGC